jgi:hypothetical protein
MTKSAILTTMNRWRTWLHFSWQDHLAVRRGFLLGTLAGFSVVGSLLWAIPTVTTLWPQRFGEPLNSPLPAFLPQIHGNVPSELAWFFIQYPYVSESAEILLKNRHTVVVNDTSRHRKYVVNWGQRYRRVEIYTEKDLQVQVYTPGSKRTVKFSGVRVVSQTTVPDGNLWMWKGPLWNNTHFKIYGMADLWLDSPYKRFSCAGFVHRFLKDVNIQVPVLDAWDMAKLPWVRIPVEELEPGDIITINAMTARHRRFWGHRVTHVGVYIGNGKLIHATTASVKSKRSWVRIADLEDFRKRIDKIIRPPELL